MNSRKFGQLAWPLLHSLPKIVSCGEKEWSESLRESFSFVVFGNAMILPCKYCRESFRVFVRAIDLRKWIQGPRLLQPVTQSVASNYLFTLHNMVNQKLNKPWQFDLQPCLSVQLLHNEQKLMQTLFEWLYILFLNYPNLKRPGCEKECCDSACRQLNQGIANISKRSPTNESDSSAVSYRAQQCHSQSLGPAIEHIKKTIIERCYMASANAQGVTIGSYINRHLFDKTYDEMLSSATKTVIDRYTFYKICWYIVYVHHFTKLLLQTDVTTNSLIGVRSPEAVRSIRQIRQTFLHPISSNKQLLRCRCREGVSICLHSTLGSWSSSKEAVRHLHFAQTVWDSKTESLEETEIRIEKYRVQESYTQPQKIV